MNSVRALVLLVISFAAAHPARAGHIEISATGSTLITLGVTGPAVLEPVPAPEQQGWTSSYTVNWGGYMWHCAYGSLGGGNIGNGCPYSGSLSSLYCPTESDALALFQKFYVGRTQTGGYRSIAPDIAEFRCHLGAGHLDMWVIRDPGGRPPEPTSCTANGGDITMKGGVGQRLTATAVWRVRCDKRADVRLTLEGNGEVPLDGGGIVRLQFRESGSSVLEIDSDAPAMNIDGELRTVLPAGVYRGAAIIRLDVI